MIEPFPTTGRRLPPGAMLPRSSSDQFGGYQMGEVHLGPIVATRHIADLLARLSLFEPSLYDLDALQR